MRNPRLPVGPTIADVLSALTEVRRRVAAVEASLEAAPPHTDMTRTAREELEYWWHLCSYEEQRAFLLRFKYTSESSES